MSGNQTVSYKTLKVLLFTLCTKNILLAIQLLFIYLSGLENIECNDF